MTSLPVWIHTATMASSALSLLLAPSKMRSAFWMFLVVSVALVSTGVVSAKMLTPDMSQPLMGGLAAVCLQMYTQAKYWGRKILRKLALPLIAVLAGLGIYGFAPGLIG